MRLTSSLVSSLCLISNISYYSISSFAETFDDLVIDLPNAPKYLALFLTVALKLKALTPSALPGLLAKCSLGVNAAKAPLFPSLHFCDLFLTFSLRPLRRPSCNWLRSWAMRARRWRRAWTSSSSLTRTVATPMLRSSFPATPTSRSSSHEPLLSNSPLPPIPSLPALSTPCPTSLYEFLPQSVRSQ